MPKEFRVRAQCETCYGAGVTIDDTARELPIVWDLCLECDGSGGVYISSDLPHTRFVGTRYASGIEYVQLPIEKAVSGEVVIPYPVFFQRYGVPDPSPVF